MTDAVQHHFRPHASQLGMGKIAMIRFVGFVWPGRQLIRPRRADVAHQFAEVVVVFGERLAELIEQFRIARGIADAHVIHFIDDAAAEEVRPDDVREVLGKVRVLGRRQPLGQHFTAVASCQIRLGAAQKLRLHGAATDEMVTSPPPELKTIVSRGSSPCLRPIWEKNAAKP